MSALADMAAEYASRSSSPFLGVVLMKPPPAFPERGGNWELSPMRSRAALVEWYNGWIGSPTLYSYLGAFENGIPFAEADDTMTASHAQISGPHGGGGHGRGGRGRRFGGGWGGGWGWGWPYYYGDCYAYDAYGRCLPPPGMEIGMDPHALSVSGHHRGNIYRSAPPAGQLPALAPLLTWPSAIPSRIEIQLDGHMLTVAVQLDDKVYRGAADLSQVFDVARAYLTAWHEAVHQQGHLLVGGSTEVPDAGGLVAQDVVGKTCDLLVGALCERHRRDHAVACAGWWSDISHAVTSAAKGIEHTAEGAVKDAAKTLSALKGPIMTAAAGAASAAALAIPGAGPLVAPLAGSLAKNLVDAATGGGSVQKAAQQVVQQAAQMAAQNPQVQAALDTAHQAVTQATAGYHTAQTFANAAAGDPNAQGQVAQLVDAAQSGDQAATNALDVASAAAGDVSAAVDQTIQQPADLAAADAAAVQGASPRELASEGAKQFPARVVGVVQTVDGNWQLQGFPDSDSADDWYGSWLGMPHAYAYVAYFDKGASFPSPENESYGHPAAVARHGEPFHRPEAAQVSGWLGVLAGVLAGAGGALYGPDAWRWARDKWQHRHAAQVAPAAHP